MSGDSSSQDLLAAAAAGAGTTALAASASPDSAVSPSALLQQFTAGGGSFVLSQNSRIVVPGGDSALADLIDGPQGWVQKLRLATGLALPVVVGGATQAGDIVLSSTPTAALTTAASNATFTWNGDTKSIGSNVTSEGYGYDASSDNLTISFISNTGALRGLQTVGQMLLGNGETTGQHRTLPTGSGIDYPDFGTRGVMVDVGRKFVSVQDLIGLMDEMSASKLNTLHLHLSDNVDADKGAGGAHGYLRLYDDSEPDQFKVLKPKDSPSDGADRTYYTKADIQTLEDAAAQRGIEIVPEIDSPGHARVFTNAHPEFLNASSTGIDPSVIDVDNTNAVQYVTSAIEQFASWFSTKTFHVGGDEPYGLATDKLNTYLENLRANLQQAGIGTDQISAWNNWGEDQISLGNGATSTGPDYGVDVWYPTPKAGLAGKTWLDISNDRYYVPGVKKNGDGTISYNSYGESGAKGYQTVIDTLNRSGIAAGGELGVWNDQAEAFPYNYDTINTGIAQALPAMGYAYWHGIATDSGGNPLPYSSVESAAETGLLEFESMRIRQRFPYMTGDQALQLLKDTSGYKGFDTDPATGRPKLDTGHVSDYGATAPFGYDPQALATADKGPVVFRDGTFVADLDGQAGATSLADTWTNTIGDTDPIAAAEAAYNQTQGQANLQDQIASLQTQIQNTQSQIQTLQSEIPTQAQTDSFLDGIDAAKGDINAFFNAAGANQSWFSILQLINYNLQDPTTGDLLDRQTLADLIAAAIPAVNDQISTLTAQIPTLTAQIAAITAQQQSQGQGQGTAPTHYVGALDKTGKGTLTLAGAGSTYSGGTTLDGGALEIAALGAAGTGAITFGAGAETLILDAAAFGSGSAFTNTIAGLAAGDAIDVRGIASSGASAAVAGTTLTLQSGGATRTLTLQDATTATLSLSDDGNGGTLVSVTGVTPSGGGTSPGGGTDPTTTPIPTPPATVPSVTTAPPVTVPPVVTAPDPYAPVTVQNPDGSTTTTVAAPDGTSTTIVATPDGTSTTTVLTPDGTSAITVLIPDGTSTTTVLTPDGSRSVKVEGGPFFDNRPYVSVTDNYAPDGTQLSETRERTDGTHATAARTPGQSIASVANDTLSGNGQPSTTFVFTPGFGQDNVLGFDAFGPDHGTLSLASSSFSSLLDVLHNTHNTAAGAVITDPTSGDTILVSGVTKAQLLHNKADIGFHA